MRPVLTILNGDGMKIERFGLEQELAASLIKGVAESQYSLLTGAGFSLGAKARNGDVPSAKRCAEILNEKFELGLTIASAADLSIAYEDALDASSGHQAVHSLFEDLFTGCVPSWQGILSQLEWRRVWTLNVDDLPEAIWAGSRRNVQHLDFTERYRPPNSETDELQVIYLHGRAAAKRRKGGRYIFSITEYVTATKDVPPWHAGFFTEFNDRPFILCGASAVGEFDLARTFRSGNQSLETTGFPSLAVVKGLDIASAKRFKSKLKLIPLDVDGQSFFSALVSDVAEYRRANPVLLSPRASAADARVFGHQFRSLDSSHAVPSSRKHDFHLGDEPEWSDIVSGVDAQLSFSRMASDFIRAELGAGRVPVVCVVGDPGCGKSSTLLRVLRNCSEFDGSAYLFRGEESLAVGSAVKCLSPNSPTVLGFDMAADFAADISLLVKGVSEKKLPVALVVADRLRRKKGLVNDIRADQFLLIDHSTVTSGDALFVHEARKKQHRLGEYVARPASDFRKLIVQKHGGNLFSGLAEVEGGKGYYRRLDDHGEVLDQDAHSMLLAHAICLTHRWGYALPLRCAALVSRLGVSDLVDACKEDGRFADIFVVDSKGIRFRHRILADYYFDRFADSSILYDAAKDIVELLAPLVNVDAIRGKSYPYLICRVLMERKSVTAAVGSVERARDFYRDLEPAIGGNSRFWEQRALLESEAGNHAAAYSYAHEAISRERHAFPLTTLGRICMAQALDMADTSTAAAFDKFKEGNAALLEARAVGANRPETLGHPFTCFFDYAIRAYPVVGNVGGASAAMRTMWESWSADAVSTKVFRDGKELDSYRAKWMKVVLGT
jgi:hypothetical protein